MWPVMTNQGPVFMSYDQSEGTWVSTRPAASSRAPSSSSAPPSPPGSGCRSPSGTTAHSRDCSALTNQIWEPLSYTETSECGMGGFLPVREPEELGWQKLLLSAILCTLGCLSNLSCDLTQRRGSWGWTRCWGWGWRPPSSQWTYQDSNLTNQKSVFSVSANQKRG